uniref:Uncharacterized protein n=1 Tax=Salix viminalis TaxID=40686 RepID=A0A6N2NL01_SALVM
MPTSKRICRECKQDTSAFDAHLLFKHTALPEELNLVNRVWGERKSGGILMQIVVGPRWSG